MSNKKFTLLTLFFAALFVMPISLAIAAPFTVVTYNIANYMDHGNWPERVHLLAQAIEAAHADVVVLQEVRFNPDEVTTQQSGENMAEQLLRQLNLDGDFLSAQLVFQPAMYYPFLNDGTSHNYPLTAKEAPSQTSYYWEGLGIISKLPIVETGSYFFTQSPQCTDVNKRILQYIAIRNHNQKYYFVNVHYGLDESCIRDNVHETILYVHRFAKNAPLLLMGDMNATPDDAALSDLSKNQFTDVWAALHAKQSGFTFPSNQPIKRIDYIWANATMMGMINANTPLNVVGNQSNQGVYPSDHLGLMLSVTPTSL